MKKLVKWISNISHLFAKTIVSVCITCVIYFGERTLQIQETTGHDTSPALAVLVGFFGGELMCLLLKTIFEKKKKDKEAKSDTEEEVYYEG